jgi:ATP-binding cassette subfamily B protein
MQDRPHGGGRRPQSPAKDTPKNFQERVQDVKVATANIPLAFKLVWYADKGSTIFMALLTIISAALPATQAWVGKLIIDSVINSVTLQIGAEAGLKAAFPYLMFEFGLIVLSAVIAQLRRLAEHILNSRLGHHINSSVINKALTLDLQYFEDANFYDKLQNARREADMRALGIINGGFLALQNAITLISFAAILIAFNPLIALILFGATIPSFIAQSRYSSLYFRLITWRAPEARRMNYFEHLLTVDNTVKEIKLFGLGQPLLQRYSELFWKFFREDVKLARRRSMISLVWGIVASLSYYAAYAWIIFAAASASITIGSMTFYLTLFRQSQGTFQNLFENLNRLYENGLFMDNLFSYLNLTPQMNNTLNPVPMPQQIKQGLEFRNVWFQYPGREGWALRDVNLHIAPGEKIALVGQNGAGKTTIIKLLTRLYDPNKGQILLDGVDLREYDIDELRKRIGVIFQDFVRYQLSARENIGFGQIEDLGNEQRILDAAERGGADEVMEELPQGYDTMLGRWFEQGAELSGGQWQKIALARAFMRDGEVLVLDEPTSALDAEREYEIFERFRELTKGKIAVLISHRFSTVRMADRIAVIENGQIAELGSHEELVALRGTYARLFELQAKGYR